MPFLPARCFAGDHFVVSGEADLPISVLKLHVGQFDARRGTVRIAGERGAQQGDLLARGTYAESGVHQTSGHFLRARSGVLFSGKTQDNRAGQGAKLVGSAAVEALESDLHIMILGKGLPGIVVPVIACADCQTVWCAKAVEKLDEKIFHPHLIEFLEDVGCSERGSSGVANDQEGWQEVVASSRNGFLEVEPIDEPCRFR